MKIKTITTMSLLGVILFLSQIAFAFLPNIELVSFLIIIYTLSFGKKIFYIIYEFVLLEGLIYGFGTWWIMYIYVWSILALIVLLFKKSNSIIIFSIISGVFGLSFGFLCSLVYFVIGGWKTGFAYWISGIPFDILHCISNIVIILILFHPFSHIFKIITKKAILN